MNGIIPLIYKRIICVLWKGHNYIPVSPEDLDGKRLFECKYCKKQRVLEEIIILNLTIHQYQTYKRCLTN